MLGLVSACKHTFHLPVPQKKSTVGKDVVKAVVPGIRRATSASRSSPARLRRATSSWRPLRDPRRPAAMAQVNYCRTCGGLSSDQHYYCPTYSEYSPIVSDLSNMDLKNILVISEAPTVCLRQRGGSLSEAVALVRCVTVACPTGAALHLVDSVIQVM